MNSEKKEGTVNVEGGTVKYVNSGIIVFSALYFFIIPGIMTIHDLCDPGIRQNKIPDFAYSIHRDLSPKYAEWAQKRLETECARDLSTADISGTEWPLFGSVFFLWATESLQQAWEENHSLSRIPPREYASDAIDAAVEIITDPVHASWVKVHWGDNYLNRENVFYRMLLMAGITAHYNLTGKTTHLPLLRKLVKRFKEELENSPYGLMDDYPHECYPGDVLTAVACVRRTAAVLNMNNTSFVTRALRGFTGKLLDSRHLPPYAADSKNGVPEGPSRGCSNSYVCLFSPELWPAQASEWYDLYKRYFWQEGLLIKGFREFPKDLSGNEWYMDVDSGPVIGGYGIAASAFGVGAARSNGRFDHAYPLTAEMIAFNWRLPHGTLLLPRLLSNSTDAPYLGEAAILFNVTRRAIASNSIREGGSIPGIVYIVVILFFCTGFLLAFISIWSALKFRKSYNSGELHIPHAKIQFFIWTLVIPAGLLIAVFFNGVIGLTLMLVGQFLPRTAVYKSNDETLNKTTQTIIT